MPTYLALENEGPWWNAEKMSPTMATLAVKLRTFFQVSASAIGAKGDNAPGHMRGSHRSRNWILNSSYCTNRTYTVSETPGNRTGGDGDWLAGMDITVPSAQLIPMCQRLDAAVRSGRLEKITEWYGNDDGDSQVDGYNNIRNVVATSDSSHLWHLHITFDRGRAGEDHSDLYEILTGEDMTPEQAQQLKDIWHAMFVKDSVVRPADSVIGKIDQTLAAVKAGPTPAQLAAISAAAKSGAEAGAPTHEELKQAAFEGAQEAEDK